MIPIHLTTEELSQFVTDTQTPVAVLAEQIDHPSIDMVYINDNKATYEATRWMIEERGYTSIGFVGAGDEFPPGPRRFDGFSRALAENGLSLDPRFFFKGDFTREYGEHVARQLIAIGELPRALVVGNDLMAIGLILTLQEAGYSIPEDVAVLGFDNIPEATIVRPSLTTIAQYPRDIGERLADLLFSRIEDPTLPRRSFEGKYQLIVRDSA